MPEELEVTYTPHSAGLVDNDYNYSEENIRDPTEEFDKVSSSALARLARI